MDAFFAAIEERDTPAFRGVPLVVGADPLGGKGEGSPPHRTIWREPTEFTRQRRSPTAWRLSEAARLAGSRR